MVGEDPSGLNAYVVGDVLRTMCRSPSTELLKEMPTGEYPIILELTPKGIDFLKKNVNDLIKEHSKLIYRDEPGTIDDFFEIETNFNTDPKIKSEKKKVYLEEERLDITQMNGSYKLVLKSPIDVNSLINQNIISSAPVHTVSDGKNTRTLY